MSIESSEIYSRCARLVTAKAYEGRASYRIVVNSVRSLSTINRFSSGQAHPDEAVR